MSTPATKKSEIQRNWHLIDADKMVLGRLSTEVVKFLMGKHKVNYSPNLEMGDKVVVINAKKVVLTGTKESTKRYYRHSGRVGKLRMLVASQLRAKDPRKLIYLSVKGMLPKNRLRKARLANLYIYPDADHPHKGQIKNEGKKQGK